VAVSLCFLETHEWAGLRAEVGMETWMLAIGAVVLVAVVFLVVSIKQARDEDRRQGRG
jgi:hypothetical protein